MNQPSFFWNDNPLLNLLNPMQSFYGSSLAGSFSPPPASPQGNSLLELLVPLLLTRRSVFVSYHHELDQDYYGYFSRLTEDHYGVVNDNSSQDIFDSANPEYVIQQIRDKNITGTSCTFVLCGPQTWGRKYVDWEIKATLDKEHALIGIALPNNPAGFVPERLYANIQSGYALWLSWASISDAAFLKSNIELAISRQKNLIRNWQALRLRNV